MPVVYSLTRLTGRGRNDNRRIVVLTVETGRRTFIVLCLSAVASAPVTGLVAMFVGVYALVVPPIVIGLGLWLWDSRSRKGLKLRNYQAIIDRRRAVNGVLYAAGKPIPEPQLIMHQQQTIPAPDGGVAELDTVKGQTVLSTKRAVSTTRRKANLESRINT